MVLMLLRTLVDARDTNNLSLVLAVQVEQVLVLGADRLILVEAAQSLDVLASLHDALLRECIELVEVELVVDFLQRV